MTNALKLQQLKQDKHKRDSMALIALASLGLAAASLLLQFFLFLVYAQLARKPAPSLVQLQNGKAMPVQAMGHLERDPAVVQRFVTDSLILLMSWHNQLPAQRDEYGNLLEPQSDSGVEVTSSGGHRRRITTAAFQSSFTFSEGFRQELLQLLAGITPEGVFSGQVQTVLMFQAVTIPEALEPGRWSVTVVGYLVHSQMGSADTQRIPFNKEVIVRAVDTPPLPQGGELASPLEQAIYAIRQAGLEIELMRDLEPGVPSAPSHSSSSSSAPAPSAPSSSAQSPEKKQQPLPDAPTSQTQEAP